MARGERVRSGGTRGIARFLAEHQYCAAGFEVRSHEPGGGRLSITCQGCGEAVTYRAADAGELAAADLTLGNGEWPQSELAAAQTERTRAPSPFRKPRPSAGSAPPGAGSLKRKGGPEAGGRGRPAWLPTALIAGLILAGLGIGAVGVLRSGDGGGPTSISSGQAPAPPQTSEITPAPQQGATKEPAPPKLQPQTFADRFSIGVPAAWEDGISDGGVALGAPGNSAEVRIFFEAGGRPLGQLARSAGRFMAGEHRGARISSPVAIRIDGARGLKVRAAYAAGEEVAVVLSEAGIAYLILRRVDGEALPRAAREADAIVKSFKPV